MAIESKRELQTSSGSVLSEALGQSEHIQALLLQSAEELCSANIAMERELANGDRRPGVKSALEKNAAVTRTMEKLSERLTALNLLLRDEIRDRTMVDYQLAAAVEQEVGSRHAALHDHLTGLPNRVLFRDRLEHGIAHAKRQGLILAVMFVDLDNFKCINDRYGHAAGDAVLKIVAKRLADNTRDEDTVGRCGGDEFLCLLTPLHGQKDVAIIAEKILQAIRAPCVLHAGDVAVNLCLEASIGVSVYPKDGSSAAVLITRADDAMYAAKESNAGIVFSEEGGPTAECTATHRRPTEGGIGSRHAPRILDVEPPAIDPPLPGEGRQKIRAH